MMRPLTIAACLTLTTAAAFASQPAASDQATTPTPAATAPATPAAPKGDATKGLQLTYTCLGCHGVTGYKNAYPNYHVPKIGGQTEETDRSKNCDN